MFNYLCSLLYVSCCQSAVVQKNLKERSHGALIAAVKELYYNEPKAMEILEIMDSYGRTRHGIQYSGIGCTKEDAGEAIKDAEKFIGAADKILAKQKD